MLPRELIFVRFAKDVASFFCTLFLKELGPPLFFVLYFSKRKGGISEHTFLFFPQVKSGIDGSRT